MTNLDPSEDVRISRRCVVIGAGRDGQPVAALADGGDPVQAADDVAEQGADIVLVGQYSNVRLVLG